MSEQEQGQVGGGADVVAQVTNWQSVDRLLDRIEVPGGWLYRTWGLKKAEPAMVFVPHPMGNH